MKKKLLIGLFILVLCACLTGCGDGSFTMVCNPEGSNEDGIKSSSVITYYFNKDQLATGYTAITDYEFEEKDVYDTHIKSTQETVDSNKEENVEFKLDKNDSKKSFKFTMTIKNLDKEAKTDEEKENLKASNVWKTNKETKSNCTLKGISEDKLK